MADLDIRINKMEKSCLEAARKELKSLKEEKTAKANGIGMIAAAIATKRRK